MIEIFFNNNSHGTITYVEGTYTIIVFLKINALVYYCYHYYLLLLPTRLIAAVTLSVRTCFRLFAPSYAIINVFGLQINILHIVCKF